MIQTPCLWRISPFYTRKARMNTTRRIDKAVLLRTYHTSTEDNIAAPQHVPAGAQALRRLGLKDIPIQNDPTQLPVPVKILDFSTYS